MEGGDVPSLGVCRWGGKFMIPEAVILPIFLSPFLFEPSLSTMERALDLFIRRPALKSWS